MTRLIILTSAVILLLGFINILNSYSLDITRVGLLDDLCKDNPLCTPLAMEAHSQILDQPAANNSTSDLPSRNSTENQTLLTYGNSTLGFEIQYPIWLNKTDKAGRVQFTFPDENAGVVITTSNVEPTSRNNSTMNHLLHLNKTLDNLFILNTAKSDLMGYPTPTILFTYNNNTELYKGIQFWKIKDDQVTLFTFFAPAETVFDKWLPTVDRMSKTIKIS